MKVDLDCNGIDHKVICPNCYGRNYIPKDVLVTLDNWLSCKHCKALLRIDSITYHF